MNRQILIGELAILILCSFLLYGSFANDVDIAETAEIPVAQEENDPIEFAYHFDSTGVLHEADSPEHSSSPYWWLDSGALMHIRNGNGQTVQEEIGDETWRRLYARNNPRDTDAGRQPQNIFRLITKSEWKNSTQEARVRIEEYNESQSPNRNESNGILLLNRYQNEDNLYYAGIRVDGHVVIKKKIRGVYHTLAEAPYLSGTYNRESEPNLLPVREWIGLRSRVTSLSGNEVKIELYIEKDGEWKKALEATDTGETAPTIDDEGHAGIRTDFMDASFESYLIREVET